jgi:diaminohydroxyphosphoribosylaminopyrimidine deaminase / 5-amino-6-(5-phosphoribosylamino)uracil reductase
MTETDDIKFMRRCLELAIKAEGLTYPNPMVGSVIVYEGNIIGEGYHLRSGEPHAEVNALNSVMDKSKLKQSTLYVNLEPCSHFGKTPPCADLIISEGIPRIVLGTVDTSTNVSGKGAEKLREAGREVIAGVLEDECRYLNRRFFTFHEKRRPYITLKWAQSSDGYIDIIRAEGQKNEPRWISGKPERVLVHKWRASEEAILAGADTVRSDNPRLDVREWVGHNPVKLILSSSGTFTGDIILKNTDARLVIFTHNPDADVSGSEKIILDKNLPSAVQISDYLYSSGIQSLFIEGGAEVLNHFISAGLWDEARIFKGGDFFRQGVRAPVINGKLYYKNEFSGSTLEIYLRN